MTTSPSVRAAALHGTRPQLEVVRTEQSPGERLRADQIRLYSTVLRSMTSKRGQPFDEGTIAAYVDSVRAWGAWLTENGFEAGFEECRTLHYNGFLADYLRTHTLGGAVSKQGNLRPFLVFLADEFEIANLWDDPKRNRYNRKAERKPTLAEELIEDLLAVTTGRGFTEVRDHAIIRLLLNGPRRKEVASLDVESLDLVSPVRTVFLTGLKGHPGRRIGLGNKDVLALERWLRVRSRHPRIGRYPNDEDGNPLWIAFKTGKRMQPTSIYCLLRERAVEAGYEASAVYTHLFRHTAAHEYLDAGGTDSNAMAQFGWRDRSMLDHYGSGQAENRAIKAQAQMGFGDRH